MLQRGKIVAFMQRQLVTQIVTKTDTICHIVT